MLVLLCISTLRETLFNELFMKKNVFSSVFQCNIHTPFYVDFRRFTSIGKGQNGHLIPHQSYQWWWLWQWHWHWRHFKQPNIDQNSHLGFLPTGRIRLLQGSHSLWPCWERRKREQEAQAGQPSNLITDLEPIYILYLFLNYLLRWEG